jgi:protein transport protein SEC13
VLVELQVPVWRVSWSVTGNLLAVSDANHEVTLWKEQLDGSWTQIQSVQ